MRRSARLASSSLQSTYANPYPPDNGAAKEAAFSGNKRIHCSTSKNVSEADDADLTSKPKEMKRQYRKSRSTMKQTATAGLVLRENKTEIPENQPELNPGKKKYVGAHVSIGGGLENAVAAAVSIGAKAFGLFLRSQRQWNSKPLDEDTAAAFRCASKAAGFAPEVILPHGIYLMNCGSPDDNTLTKSRATLVDELQRCEKLGLVLYNFHPGSTRGKISVDDCLDRIAESINYAHKRTSFVTTVIENMSCQGNTVRDMV